MFTKNYEAFRGLTFTAYGYDSGKATFTDISGTERDCIAYMSGHRDIGCCMRYPKCAEIPVSKSASGFWGGLYFGSGSAPATKNDYKLEHPIISGLSFPASKQLVLSQVKEGTYAAEISHLVTNTTGADINIWEVGAVTHLCTTVSSNNTLIAYTTDYPILLERTVFDEPITIPAGESKLVTYKITFNQTLNVD